MPTAATSLPGLGLVEGCDSFDPQIGPQFLRVSAAAPPAPCEVVHTHRGQYRLGDFYLCRNTPHLHNQPSAVDDLSLLMSAAYGELQTLARAYMRGQKASHTLQPTALVNEAFLRLARADSAILQDRARFLAVAATAMRQILINHAEARATTKRGGGQARVQVDQGELLEAGAIDLDRVLDVDAALRKLETLDARKAKVVEAKVFGGMANTEVAESLGLSLSTIESDWRMARAWLAKELDP